jgi:hypothetical protein
LNIKFRKSSYKLAGNGSSKVVSAGSNSSIVGIAKTSTIAISTRVGISRVAIAISSTIASIGSSKLGLGLSLSLSIESPVSKTIAMSSIAKVSIAIGSRVGVSRVAHAISSSVASIGGSIAIVAIVTGVGRSQVLGISLRLGLSLSLSIEASVSKTIAISSIAKVSIAIGSRVGVSRVAKTISSSIAIEAIEAIVSSVGGSQVLGISLGLSLSLSLAIVVTLGHWVKALGDGIQTRAGAEGESGIGVASMAKTRVAIAQTREASIAESTIAIASIGIASIAKLSLSRGSGDKGRNNQELHVDKMMQL